VQYKNILAMI